ncbi:MAG: hydrogenase [Sulfurovum sp.]|nr:hydrogenase [Sulfurovum sp.]MCB4777946.1 hydrogenase [Sulfurovum sp.]MCB4778957.1 hydrogenase [Sulfurovum sp.]MCB4784179.1 hydrogenase [Sulfurovum sp.]
MILEYKLDYRSSSQQYEKIFVRVLKSHGLVGKAVKEHFTLYLYVDAPTVEKLEAFSTDFAVSLPHSIFLYESEASVVEEIPDNETEVDFDTKLPSSFCPKCLKEVMDETDENYYNIFTECEVCGYGATGENRSYKKEIADVAQAIKEGKVAKVDTFYGSYYIVLPSTLYNEISADMLCYDLATIEAYTYAQKYEITTLGTIEKPLIKLKKKKKLLIDFEEIEADLLRFKLPDDMVLHLLMEELHLLGIDIVMISKDELLGDVQLSLVNDMDEMEPIEVVVSENATAIVSGNKGLPEFPIHAEKVNPSEGSFYSVIKEHHLEEEVVAGMHLSKEYKNNMLAYGKKFGTLEYLSFEFTFHSMQEIFDQIVNTNETGIKIVEKYKNKFLEHFEKISKITFDETTFNLYKLWGIVSIVLDFSQTDDPLIAAKILEENAMTFLGEKGPRIDYKLINHENKVYLDPLMTIRTAMSFKLAGVDTLTLSYGVIESFLEFIANELDEMKQNMDISAVVVTGSLLGNRHLFSKMSKEISVNHNIYFNNELTVEGNGMFYGGTSL